MPAITFGYDLLSRPNCGGKMTLTGCVWAIIRPMRAISGTSMPIEYDVEVVDCR